MGPGYIPPSFQPPTTSLFADSGELDWSLSLLSQFDNILPIPFSLNPFYDNPTLSGYEARQSSEPSVFYPDPTLYSPRRISSWPDQSAIPANESLHPYPNPLLPDQRPPHLFHLKTDATPWTGVDNVDIPLCLSPTSIPPSVPDALPVEYPPTPKDGLAPYQTPPSTGGSSSTRSSTSQTSFESTLATDVPMGLVVAGVPQLTLFDAQPLVGNVTVSSSC